MRDTYNRSVDETEMDVLAPVLQADLLVLDDLGAERTSEWVQETLGLVVNTRYNERRPTIFTSNLVDSPDSTDPAIVHLPAGGADPLAADGDVRLGGDARRRRARDRTARIAGFDPALAEGLAGLARKPAKERRASPEEQEHGAARGCGIPGAAELAWPGGRAGTKR